MGSRPQAYFLAHNLSHSNGVKNIGLARTAADTLMSVLCKSIGTLDYFHLLAVITFQISVQDILEGFINKSVFLFRCQVQRVIVFRFQCVFVLKGCVCRYLQIYEIITRHRNKLCKKFCIIFIFKLLLFFLFDTKIYQLCR